MMEMAWMCEIMTGASAHVKLIIWSFLTVKNHFLTVSCNEHKHLPIVTNSDAKRAQLVSSGHSGGGVTTFRHARFLFYSSRAF